MDLQNKGLAGIVVGQTALSQVDGAKSELRYCGYNIEDLIQGSFEESCFLLLHGRLPTPWQLRQFCEELVAYRPVPSHILDFIRKRAQGDAPMAVLLTAVSMLSSSLLQQQRGDGHEHNAAAARVEKAKALIAKTATLVAAIGRARGGLPLLSPQPDLGHAANFFAMLQDKPATQEACQTLNTALVLHADHELNASTFVARATASTESDMVSAVVAAMASLKGRLHGGANTAVMHMLREVGSEKNVSAWLDQALVEKRLIMGFGHRVYQTGDPRAKHLRLLSQTWCERTGQGKWFCISDAIDKQMRKRKGLRPNVDFYSASLYCALGIDSELYTPLFAVSRMAGWTAHVLEQRADNRLIRPRAEYIGAQARPYIALKQR